MSTPSYVVPGLVLSPSNQFSPQVRDLQRDLRSLGYTVGSADGIFGNGTATAVKAIQYDLINNTGAGKDGSAPVAVKSYNDGSVTSLTGIVDQGLAGCIAAILSDSAFPKLPSSANVSADNQAAVDAVRALAPSPVPVPYLMAILYQESGCRHFQSDSFVTAGLDRNNQNNPSAITSRGYGIGQYTFFHHPPTSDEVASCIADPAKNVAQAVSEFLSKFRNFVNGPSDTADDRIHEFGTGPLRTCQYDSSDSRYMSDCVNCLKTAPPINITAGSTPVYEGASMMYDNTQYHKQASYGNVPLRKAIPCDWPYAVRRYNGSGVNSYDYQAEVLLKVLSVNS